MGAVLGILTPFCSCSSIPLFIGFSSAGLPIGVTLSFLIMSPMADLGSMAVLMTQFGWKIAEKIIQSVLGGEHWYSVILACFVGIPMYADIFGAIPIAGALLAKGAGLGTVVSFLMSITALSLPSIIMLSKSVKRKLWHMV